MKSSSLLTGPTLQLWIKRHSTALLSGVFVFFVLLFAGRVSAQTPPTIGQSHLSCDISQRNPCTSKDLEIVSIAIGGANCQTCTPGTTVTYPLYMTIHNGTKSTRTSFALYGSLSTGATINGISGNVFICVGEITVKSDQDIGYGLGNQQFAVGSISFTCGQDLTLSDNFLAWTDAAGETDIRCETYSQATKCSDIAPKCGFAESITIVGPLSAPALGKVDPTCTVSTGCVTVTSSTTGLTFSLDGGAFESYPSGGWCNLAPGEHCVRAKNASCTSDPSCITIPGAPANPDRPAVTLQEATICGTVTTPTITVCSPIVGTYTLAQTGQTDKTFNYTGLNGPVVFTVLPGIGFSITVTNAAGCTSDATTCTNYASNTCQSSTVAKQDNTQIQDIILQKKSRPTVNAAPNPFNDRIRFNLRSEVSGQGSLELYNILGQKVKTVFQGQVNAGQVQTVDYAVPAAQRAGLIYTFRVGKEETSGKLVGLKK